MGDGLAGRIDNLEETVFRGNGRPSLLARMEVSEQRQDDTEEKFRHWEGIAWKMVFSTGAAILTVLGHLLWETFKR